LSQILSQGLLLKLLAKFFTCLYLTNLLNFDFDKILCEDLENITKSHENQRSDILLKKLTIFIKKIEIQMQ
jgi:hypothetical protein